jgi:hypothetical protein
MQKSEEFIGVYNERVKCIALAPPPCVSRAVVPKFISSIISGDDIVPRSAPEALNNVKKRVLKGDSMSFFLF